MHSCGTVAVVRILLSRLTLSAPFAVFCAQLTFLVFLIFGIEISRAAPGAPTLAMGGMVVSPQADATAVGVEVLRNGGNAIDAAVAVSLALSVTDPHHSGIGGGGLFLIYLADGRTVAIDARETAPAAARSDMYLNEGVSSDASRLGGLAVATPGLLAGLSLALDSYGTMEWRDLVSPSVLLAEEGFEIGASHLRAVRAWAKTNDGRFPETARIQLSGLEPGADVAIGTRLVQKDKAKTLRSLADRGIEEFYRGELANSIVEIVQKQGGILTRDDLASYQPVVREPLRSAYRGYDVISFPPPSSGGIALIQMLQILEGFDLSSRGSGSSASMHVIAEAMKLAFADRAAHLGDPDFVSVPVWLTDRSYTDSQRTRINPSLFERPPWTWWIKEPAIKVVGPGEQPKSGGTTHFSIVDRYGNAVAVTQTINLVFGSGITVPGAGIVLNNEMDDFSIAPGKPNAFGLVDTRGSNSVAAGKRPLSSMTPTILLKDGAPFMVTGSPGGPRIITTTLLTILNVIDYKMDIQAAVSAPRFHHQWLPNRLTLEPEIPLDVINGLRDRGHVVEVSTRHWSSAQAILLDNETGIMYGGSDPRSDGRARGP